MKPETIEGVKQDVQRNLRLKGILKGGYEEWICTFENGATVNIGDLIIDERIKERNNTIEAAIHLANSYCNITTASEMEKCLEQLKLK